MLSRAFRLHYHEIVTEIYKKGEALLRNDGSTIIASNDFLELPLEIIKELLKCDELYVEEEELFPRCIEWCKYQCNKLYKNIVIEEAKGDRINEDWQQLFREIVHFIRFPVMSPSYFIKNVQPLHILTPDEVIEIQNYHLSNDANINYQFCFNPRKPKMQYSQFNFDKVHDSSRAEIENNVFRPKKTNWHWKAIITPTEPLKDGAYSWSIKLNYVDKPNSTCYAECVGIYYQEEHSKLRKIFPYWDELYYDGKSGSIGRRIRAPNGYVESVLERKKQWKNNDIVGVVISFHLKIVIFLLNHKIIYTDTIDYDTIYPVVYFCSCGARINNITYIPKDEK